MAGKKTALEKMKTHVQPTIKEGPEEWIARYGGHKMLIASPLAIAAYLQTVPFGEVRTMSEVRDALALQYEADYTCPLTTGIFLRIVAEAYEEVISSGEEENWPYWRIIRDNGELIDKFPGGTAAQAALLKAEGHVIIPKGSKSHRIMITQ